jgi:hypothetical protein
MPQSILRPLQTSWFFSASVLLGFLLLAIASHASTLQDLRDDPDLTPEALMTYFRDFTFKLREEVQDPEVFLASREGDCDDFAALAADLLRARKFTPQLVAVFMDGQTHVVCYVREVECYLDFNFRNESTPLQPTNGLLEDIAAKVSAHFRSTWHCVAEFTCEAGLRRFGRIAFR